MFKQRYPYSHPYSYPSPPNATLLVKCHMLQCYQDLTPPWAKQQNLTGMLTAKECGHHKLFEGPTVNSGKQTIPDMNLWIFFIVCVLSMLHC